MPKIHAQIPDDGLPAGLAKPAIRALNAAGYTGLRQLTKSTESELLALHGVGPNAVATLHEALEQAGLSLAHPRTD